MRRLDNTRTPTFRDYLDVVSRRRWVVILALIFTVGTAAAVSLARDPLFRATVIIGLDNPSPSILLENGVPPVYGAGGPQPGDVATLVELIKSQSVRKAAVEKIAPRLGGQRANAALDRVHVEQLRNTSLVRISVRHADPRIAAKAADAIAGSLIDLNLKAKRRQATATRAFLAAELADAGKKLRAAENALVAFKKRYGNVSLAEETILRLRKLTDLEAHRVDLQLQAQQGLAQLTAGRSSLARQTRAVVTQWTPSPLIVSLRTRLTSLENEMAGLRSQFTEDHPAVIEVQKRIDETERRLKEETARSPEPAQYGVDPAYQQLLQQTKQQEVELRGLRARDRSVATAIDQYSARLRSLPEQEVELARLAREATQAEQIVLLLGRRFQEARISEASISSPIRVVDAASVPRERAGLPRVFIILFGAGLGLVLGVFAAIVVERLDETIRSPADVERTLHLPVLGEVPHSERA